VLASASRQTTTIVLQQDSNRREQRVPVDLYRQHRIDVR
jgi:hypothetical protein